MKSLYIDDNRPTPEGYTRTARTFEEARKLIVEEDWDLISFDHDLGEEEIRANGLTLMNILEDHVFIGLRKAPLVNVHTANAAARPAMRMCAERILNMWEKQNG